MAAPAESVKTGRRTNRLLVGLFVLFLLWPWVVEMVSRGGISIEVNEAGLPGKLKQVESAVKGLAFFEDQRPADQHFLFTALNEGNSKVYSGMGGWLYYRPDLEAVFGKGPHYVEPNSVAREKVTDIWHPPLEIIAGFADQLKERGIELVMVPVPTKPMLCVSGLGLDEAQASPAAQFESVLSDLRNAGIEVVDLMPVIQPFPESARFLLKDTHWTPEAMKASAIAVADLVEKKSKSRPVKGASIRWTKRELSHRGDLNDMLGVPGDEKQTVTLEVPNGPPGKNVNSDIVLLGDSFVNIYDEPGLGFDEERNTKLGAGFAAHLAANLKRSIHTIAINGDGATGVRRELAGLPDSEVRKKKIVVWVLSARDLLLAELPSRRAGIHWNPVSFRVPESDGESMKPTSAELTIAGTVTQTTSFADPRDTPYADAVYSLLLSDLEVEKGTYLQEELFAFAWAFQKRMLSESSSLSAGKRYRFTLVPLSEVNGVSNATRVDDLFRTDLDPWFIERFEELP